MLYIAVFLWIFCIQLQHKFLDTQNWCHLYHNEVLKVNSQDRVLTCIAVSSWFKGCEHWMSCKVCNLQLHTCWHLTWLDLFSFIVFWFDLISCLYFCSFHCSLLSLWVHFCYPLVCKHESGHQWDQNYISLIVAYLWNKYLVFVSSFILLNLRYMIHMRMGFMRSNHWNCVKSWQYILENKCIISWIMELIHLLGNAINHTLSSTESLLHCQDSLMKWKQSWLMKSWKGLNYDGVFF